MKNRNRNLSLSPDELYALERRARAERAKEIGRLLATLVGKVVHHA